MLRHRRYRSRLSITKQPSRESNAIKGLTMVLSTTFIQFVERLHRDLGRYMRMRLIINQFEIRELKIKNRMLDVNDL